MAEESKPFIPGGFQWLIGILLSIIAFFLVSTFVKVDQVDTNVQTLMINDGGLQEWKKGIQEWKTTTDRRIQAMENNRPNSRERKETTTN